MRMSAGLFFEDVEVGQEWESGERVVTEADVRSFADLTGDHQPIHLDPDYARTTPYRRTIAHGLLGMSLASGLTVHSPALRTMAFLGLREWSFRAPIYPGDVLRVRSRVLGKEPRARGRRGVVSWSCQVVNQGGKVVQEGVTVLLVAARGAEPAPLPLSARGEL